MAQQHHHEKLVKFRVQVRFITCVVRPNNMLQQAEQHPLLTPVKVPRSEILRILLHYCEHCACCTVDIVTQASYLGFGSNSRKPPPAGAPFQLVQRLLEAVEPVVQAEVNLGQVLLWHVVLAQGLAKSTVSVC